jgi:hypothetical protein
MLLVTSNVKETCKQLTDEELLERLKEVIEYLSTFWLGLISPKLTAGCLV